MRAFISRAAVSFNRATSIRKFSNACILFANREAEISSKYEEKLKQKAKSLGLNNIDELKDHYKEKIETHKKQMDSMDPLKKLKEYEKIQEAKKKKLGSEVREPISKSTAKAPFKTLDSYINVEKVKELSRKELEMIWRARFHSKEKNLSAIIDAEQFSSMYANAFKNPLFILPVPKEDGHELFFIQWSFVGPHTTHCMLTTLAEYKLHKEFSRPHISISFHQELSHEGGTVLMNGEVDENSPLTMDEAQLLLLNLQRFYGATNSSLDKHRVELLRDFNSGNVDFDLEKLINASTSV